MSVAFHQYCLTAERKAVALVVGASLLRGV
jgi:hypothetical protein